MPPQAPLAQAAFGLALTFAGCGEATPFTRGDAEALSAVGAARERLAGGDAEGAYRLLAFAVERYPASLEVRHEFAEVAATTQRVLEALETYAAILACLPADTTAARGTVQIALFVGDLDRAESAVAVLLAGTEATISDLTLGARVAHERGDAVRAEERARRALARDPDNALALYWLGQSLIAREQVDAALPVLEDVLARDPGHIAAAHALGTLRLQRREDEAGQRALAAAHVSQAIGDPSFRQLPPEQRLARGRELAAALPEWSWPWVEVARAELELGRPADAERSLVRAEELRPSTAEAARLRYEAAVALDRPRAAERWRTEWEARRDGGP